MGAAISWTECVRNWNSMKNKFLTNLRPQVGLLMAVVAFSSCAGPVSNRTARGMGAGIGALGGGLVGHSLGKKSGNSTGGTVAGAFAGAVIGSKVGESVGAGDGSIEHVEQGTPNPHEQ